MSSLWPKSAFNVFDCFTNANMILCDTWRVWESCILPSWIEFYWNAAMLFWSRFCIVIVKWSNLPEPVAHNAWNICYLCVYRESLTPELELMMSSMWSSWVLRNCLKFGKVRQTNFHFKISLAIQPWRDCFTVLCPAVRL